MRDIRQVLRIMLMEFKLATHEWVYLLPLVQFNLNHTPVASLNNRAPSELFTLLPVPNPLAAIVVSRGKQDLVLEIAGRCDNVENLREALLAMHRAVVCSKDKRRRRNKDKSDGSPCNSREGGFVL